MSDISREDVQPDLERGETPSPLVRGAGRWTEELTLFQPWRSHTLKGLSQDCIAHWTDSNEAEFRDGMYHSGFKFRFCVMSSMAFAVFLMALVDPCLSMLGALTCLTQLLLMSTQIAAQRMVDKRRGRYGTGKDEHENSEHPPHDTPKANHTQCPGFPGLASSEFRQITKLMPKVYRS